MLFWSVFKLNFMQFSDNLPLRLGFFYFNVLIFYIHTTLSTPENFER